MSISKATALMSHIMGWAENAKELEKISLAVFSTNKGAMNSCQKFGFEIEGKSKKQFKIEGKYFNEVIMGKFLD